MSLRDEDKEAGVGIVRELVRMGYGVYATRGTSTRLWEAGIETKAIFRISRGRPNALDLLRAGTVKWVVCTTENGNEATEDNARLRSGAVAAGVPRRRWTDSVRRFVDSPKRTLSAVPASVRSRNTTRCGSRGDPAKVKEGVGAPQGQRGVLIDLALPPALICLRTSSRV